MNNPENREQVAGEPLSFNKNFVRAWPLILILISICSLSHSSGTEIMFETFNVPGLHISVQAVLALAASWTSKDLSSRELSGLVVDSGDGVTHVVPVADGHVLSSCIEHIPIAGKDVTNYVQHLMRERKEQIPTDQSLDVARIVKENYAYVCPDVAKEFAKYDSNPETYIRKYEGIRRSTGQTWTCDIKHERFLAAELFFSPGVSKEMGNIGIH
eukprot:8566652-Ditylum_brightwellii.AAC.1